MAGPRTITHGENSLDYTRGKRELTGTGLAHDPNWPKVRSNLTDPPSDWQVQTNCDRAPSLPQVPFQHY